MRILVDTSVWINWFRGKGGEALDELIDNNLLAINDVILAELTPALRIRKEQRLVALLETVTRLPLQVDWADIIDMQTQCLAGGINGIGIPDLMIAQNALQSGCPVYTEDKHFRWIGQVAPLRLYA